VRWIGRKPTVCKLSRLLTEARAALCWLREGFQVARQQALRTYVRALEDSFVVRRDRETAPAAASGAIGADWGVQMPAATTDPAFGFPQRGYRRRCAAEIARAQRKMARRARRRGRKLCGPQSTGYQRAQRDNAKAQQKAARRNQHDGRLWARRVTESHGPIAAGDFQPQFPARSTMARKAADASIGPLKRTLLDDRTRAGRTVALVQPARTTTTCPQWGEKQARPGLAGHTFRCPSRGYPAGRDRNAARAILAAAERGHARAGDVSHWQPPSGPAGAVRAGNPPASATGNR
jgi:putative transposase